MARRPLSDNWKRTLCRFGFLLFCLFPTFVTGYWIFHPQTPSHWEQLIQAELGLPTEIDSIETPGPYVTILRGVKFYDAKGTLFESAQIRVVRNGRNEIVVDHNVQFSNDALLRMATQVSDHLVRGDVIQKQWLIRFSGQANIYNGDQDSLVASLATRDLKILMTRYLDGPAAEISFRRVDDPAGNLVTADIHHGTNTGKTFLLRGSEVWLPCWLMADMVPDLKKLGSQCQFNGLVEVRPSDQDPDVYVSQIEGTFSKIDLAALVQDYDQTLSGTCTAGVSNYVIKNGKTVSLVVNAHCPNGTMGLDLLDSAQEHMGFLVAENVSKLGNENGVIGFRQMQLNFEIKDSRLYTWGNEQGIVAYDIYNRPLTGWNTSSPDDRPHPQEFENLARFLIRPSSNTQLVNQELLEVLDWFERPTSPLVPGPPIRLATEPSESDLK